MIPAGIVSADGHVCEPPDCYVNYIDPKYRDDAPRVVRQADGTDAFVIPGMKKPISLGFIDGAGGSQTWPSAETIPAGIMRRVPYPMGFRCQATSGAGRQNTLRGYPSGGLLGTGQSAMHGSGRPGRGVDLRLSGHGVVHA